jgi:hypothetical protein
VARNPQDFSGRCVQFNEPVGQIARDVNFFAVRRNGDASRDFPIPLRCLGERQGNREQRGNCLIPANAENFDVAVDIGQINPRAIGRKCESGET